MYCIELTRDGKVENIFDTTSEEHLPDAVYDANQQAGFCKYITQDNAPEYLDAILAFAKEQKDRADIAELKVEAAEYFEDED